MTTMLAYCSMNDCQLPDPMFMGVVIGIVIVGGVALSIYDAWKGNC